MGVQQEERSGTLGAAAVVMFYLLLPYLLVGVVRASSHRDELGGMGLDAAFLYGVQLLAWPVLLVTDLDLLGRTLT